MSLCYMGIHCQCEACNTHITVAILCTGMQMRQAWRFECRCLLVIPCELSIVEHEVSRAENPFAILGYVRLDHLQPAVCLPVCDDHCEPMLPNLFEELYCCGR